MESEGPTIVSNAEMQRMHALLKRLVKEPPAHPEPFTTLHRTVSHLQHLPELREPDEEAHEAVRLRDKKWQQFKDDHASNPKDLKQFQELSERLNLTAKDLEKYERECFELLIRRILLEDQMAYRLLLAEEMRKVSKELVRLDGPVKVAEERCRLAGGGTALPTSRHMRPWGAEEYDLVTLRVAYARAEARQKELDYLVKVIKWEVKHPEEAKARREEDKRKEKEQKEKQGPGRRSLSRSRNSGQGLAADEGGVVEGRATMQTTGSARGQEQEGREGRQYVAGARSEHPAVGPVLQSQPSPSTARPTSSHSTASSTASKKSKFRRLFGR